MSNNFSSQKQFVKPPQRGIFPLDHDSECRSNMEKYLCCLTESDNDHYKCRELSRAYLQCRMDRQLMAEDDLNKLGFSREAEIIQAASEEGIKEVQGFTAGKHIGAPRKWFWF
mmetsp:Transcript_3555/g.5287  ORF Transcript_3555/g.5287 Transcript_3555/m.5287 type:complete len:113 (+) Transcript_3555:45-383(+)